MPVAPEAPPPARPAIADAPPRVDTVDALEALLGRHLARSRRQGDPLALLWVEVDLLTPFDPVHSSRCDEAVARALGARLLHRVRETDRVFQLGVSGFAVLLDTGKPGAQLVERRLLEHLRGPCGMDGWQAHVHVHIGVAMSGDGSAQGSTLLQCAMDDVYVRRSPAAPEPAPQLRACVMR